MNRILSFPLDSFVSCLEMFAPLLVAGERLLASAKTNHPEIATYWIAHDIASKLAVGVREGIKQIRLSEQRESREIANAERAA